MSKQPSFTPGPWSRVRYTGRLNALTVEASRTPLLRMCAGRNEEANARLIAAAPELYEALNDIAKAAFMARASSNEQDREPWQMIECRARAALAKARGETPDAA